MGMVEVLLDCANDYGCFSVRKWPYTENEDGEKEYVSVPERRAFSPGQFEELEEFAPELLDQAKEIWSEDVVGAWQEKMAEIEAARLELPEPEPHLSDIELLTLAVATLAEKVGVPLDTLSEASTARLESTVAGARQVETAAIAADTARRMAEAEAEADDARRREP